MSAARTALVTGAGGFIASHLVERLVRQGWKVRCLLRYGSTGDVGFLKALDAETFSNLDIRRGDLLDDSFVAECCAGINTVFHLAARISIPYSYLCPRDTFQVNAVGTLNVVEAVRRHDVSRLIHVSTSEVYGSAVVLPMSESHRLKAQSPYAASKIAADKIVESYSCAFNVPVVIVRPFNTYGPRQSPRAVISSVIEQAIRGGLVRIGSLWPRRDFTYVDDTTNALLLAAEVDSALHQEFNLGTGRNVSIGDLAKIIIDIVGTRCELAEDDARARPADSEVSELLSDNSKAQKILQWKPQVSLEEGIRKTVTWWRQARDSFNWGIDPK